MKDLNTSALALADENTRVLDHWSRFGARKSTNSAQQRLIYRNAKSAKDPKEIATALKAAGSLYFCNRRVIVEKKRDQYSQAGAWYCGKKYCSYCSNRKRKKILNRFIDFFNSEKGKDMLKIYDLAMFTVTLKHSKNGLRKDPYYKELSTHFHNALKYGSFKKFIAGGFYNTEHTYSSRNGHHIHRHALILIPRNFNVGENFKTIEADLRSQWKLRTGGSFQIDLRPLGYDKFTESAPPRPVLLKNLNTHLLEVTKYITKRDEIGTINYQIIKAVEENSRSKFYGRFGILHKVKELNINLEVVIDPDAEQRELYIATPVLKSKKVIEVHSTKIKTKSKTIKKGIEVLNYKEKPGAKIRTWKKFVYSYTFKDLVRLHDIKKEINDFNNATRSFLSSWKDEKFNKIRNGEVVEKFRARDKNKISPIFELCSENYLSVGAPC